MKRFLISTIAILAMIVTKFSAAESIILNNVSNSSEGREHPVHKAPENYSYLPSVIYDDEEATLSFIGNADLGIISYTISDNNGCDCLSGYAYILDEEIWAITTIMLEEGEYTLSVYVNELTFEGTFQI